MDEDARPVAGFFGKIPATGDFVWRGLPDRFRQSWDAWITRHVAPALRAGDGPAAGGLRFRLVSGGRAAAGVILPSEDSAGRRFPLSLVLTADDLPSPEALDPWCDAAAAAPRDSADGLWEALDALPAPEGPPPAGAPALWLWRRGGAPVEADPADPSAALAALSAEVS
ncbi:MAG: type VI secretion system-associated protein TagF [Rhodobacteraceae bacterium]|nr:type VI secretion system-associated protein TagF [Paracoccaceae bacterium]